MIPPLVFFLTWTPAFATLPPTTGLTFPPMMGWRLGRKGCFFGKVSARDKISRIYSEESMSVAATLPVFFDAVVERVAFEPPWPSLRAAP